MPKKRTSAESNVDGQNDKESPVQREADAKRAKSDPESDTTLQDLPLELLECILVNVVAMEVRNMKMAKSVWKEKAELVMSRLGPVCTQWSSILTTNSFRTKLHRTIDNTAQKIRLDILNVTSIPRANQAITTLNDEIFLLYEQRDTHYIINVYDRDNMREAKEVILLPGTDPRDMTGCNVSNCVYVSLRQGDSYIRKVFRISKDVDHKYNLLPWRNDLRLPIFIMTVSANGSLIFLALRSYRETSSHVVSVCNSDGTLQHEVKLVPPAYIEWCSFLNLIQKSNGNVILSFVDNQDCQLKLLEFDMSGSVVRQFQSSYALGRGSFVNLAGSNDRMMVASSLEVIELLDSEFNPLGVHSLSIGAQGLKQNEIRPFSFIDSHYDRNRNEIVRIHGDARTSTNVFTTFRFTEE